MTVTLEESQGAVATPVRKDRGRLLDTRQVAGMVNRSAEWCRKNIPHKLTLGPSTVRWWERDVTEWIDSKYWQLEKW